MMVLLLLFVIVSLSLWHMSVHGSVAQRTHLPLLPSSILIWYHVSWKVNRHTVRRTVHVSIALLLMVAESEIALPYVSNSIYVRNVHLMVDRSAMIHRNLRGGGIKIQKSGVNHVNTCNLVSWLWVDWKCRTWKCRTWKCRTWKWRTKLQGVKLQGMKMQHMKLQDMTNIVWNRLHYSTVCISFKF